MPRMNAGVLGTLLMVVTSSTSRTFVMSRAKTSSPVLQVRYRVITCISATLGVNGRSSGFPENRGLSAIPGLASLEFFKLHVSAITVSIAIAIAVAVTCHAQDYTFMRREYRLLGYLSALANGSNAAKVHW